MKTYILLEENLTFPKKYYIIKYKERSDLNGCGTNFKELVTIEVY
jgi:hypothetical protein